jgi:hypothetical protein
MPRLNVCLFFILVLCMDAAVVCGAGQSNPPAQDSSVIRFRSPQLELAARLTEKAVSADKPFALIVDAVPAPRIHVYAPGVTGYRPIALAIEAQDGLTSRGPQYPASEDYYYEPLKEHVRVYQKPFQLVQEFRASPELVRRAARTGAGRVSVKGTLTYQACDDRICFPPRTIPLHWSVSVVAIR